MFWILGHSFVWLLQRYTKRRYVRIGHPNSNLSYVRLIYHRDTDGEPMVFADPLSKEWTVVHDDGLLKGSYNRAVEFKWEPFVPFGQKKIRKRYPKFNSKES